MQMKRTQLSQTIMLLVGSMTVQGLAAQEVAPAPTVSGDITEVSIVGKMKSAADDVAIERIENEVVADFIDSESIGRIGDSNVAAALRRVPGVTLVDDKFVFVRGLGERYSTSLLNGAQIPSPDLTRNVIPLDIFPTSILRSVAVQKGYSADFPAAFSGGLIDIRTLSIPEEFTFDVQVGTSFNSETTGDVLTYSGGSDDWLGTDDGTREASQTLLDAVDYYLGSLDTISILQRINLGDGTKTLADAEAINQQLATELNRNVDITEKNANPNSSAQVTIGNSFYMDNGMDIGIVAALSYDNSWSSRESTDSSFGNPQEIFSDRQESTRSVSTTGNLGLGWKWYEDHSVEATSLILRNTDDESFIRKYYTSSFNYSDENGFLNYGTRFEERELIVNQFNGSHRLGGVNQEVFTFLTIPQWLEELTYEWFYSDAESTTEIPNESTITYQTRIDVPTGDVISQNLQSSTTAGDFRFTDLNDEVENYGWDLKLPLYFSMTDVELSGGYNYARKSRVYKQTQFGLGTSNTAVAQSLTGQPSSIFSNENILNPANDLFIDVIGSNGESYLAAVTNEAVYGKVDVTWDQTWRVTAGVRWEDYSQVGLPWDPLEYRECQISCDPDEIEESVFKDDDIYPTIAFTYMLDDFWAEQFQLRFGYSETLVRPDLREITPSSYIDPITDARVSGNANVIPSSVDNFDIRGEWFFDNGDNFTASFFYKDIQNPIDLFENAAFEEALATEILNGESAEIMGIELEWLKNLAFMGDWAEPFFVQGNLIFLDSELVTGPDADAPTNPVRPLSGASEYSFNAQVGYDSWDGAHSAMLVYNIAAERLYFAGRNGTPDAYEQPFNSLDLTYFWYPTDQWTLSVKAKNLLDEEVIIEQNGIETYSEKPGTSVSMSVKFSF